MKISFDFLPKGEKFEATIYSDDAEVSTKTKMKVEKKVVTSASVPEVKLDASGEQAIRIKPYNNK